MLYFICSTCGKKYEVSLADKVILYIDENKRIALRTDDQDCVTCEEKIKETIVQTRRQIREKITQQI